MELELAKTQLQLQIQLERGKRDIQMQLEREKARFQFTVRKWKAWYAIAIREGKTRVFTITNAVGARKTWQLEQEKRDSKEKELQMRLQLQQNKYDFEMAKLQENKAIKTEDQGHFNISVASKFVPNFQDDDLDEYFLATEKTAALMKWPRGTWAMLLQTKLSGKSQEVYAFLDLDICNDYDQVKKILFQCNEQVPEVYRQKFRQYYKSYP